MQFILNGMKRTIFYIINLSIFNTWYCAEYLLLIFIEMLYLTIEPFSLNHLFQFQSMRNRTKHKIRSRYAFDTP